MEGRDREQHQQQHHLRSLSNTSKRKRRRICSPSSSFSPSSFPLFFLLVLVLLLLLLGYLSPSVDGLATKSECSGAADERHDCGWFGITPEECRHRFLYGRYCCFDPTPMGAAPQCFHSNDSVFTVPLEFRRDCGWPGIDRGECDRRQCSFSHAVDEQALFKQCFYPRLSPCFIPETTTDRGIIACELDQEESEDLITDTKKIRDLRRECETRGCCYDPSATSLPRCYRPDMKRTLEGMSKWVSSSWWSSVPLLSSIIESIPTPTRNRLALIFYPLSMVLFVVFLCLWSSAAKEEAVVRAKEI